MASSSISQLSASVTRILSLTGFPKELKTRDIQSAFSEYENASGGFKIKWIDDTSLLVVFADAAVGKYPFRDWICFTGIQPDYSCSSVNLHTCIAKRAYLYTLANPPAIFSNSESTAVIRPYDGPDAQTIIQNVNSRGNGAGRGHNARASSVAIPGQQRTRSSTNGNGNGNHNGGMPAMLNGSVSIPNGDANGLAQMAGPTSPIGREGSPTLPTLPSHPTLDSLINLSMGDGAPPSDPAILASSLQPNGAGPRIGDPGKRMLGAALGVRHPGLPPRAVNGQDHPSQGMEKMHRAMGGLTVAE